MNTDNENTRRHYSPEEKVKILRRHLLDGQPISEVCEKEHINPTLFYQWQKTFFENGAAAFAKQPTEGSTITFHFLNSLESKGSDNNPADTCSRL
jgi:transposase-like protein